MAWGWLKNIAKIGAGVAAPFTGGLSALAIPAIDAIGAVGQGAGAYAQGQAQNRGAEFGGQLDLERLLMDRDRDMFSMNMAREQEGRAGRNDAFTGLMRSQRVLSPAARPQNLSPYSAAPRQSTDTERQGAQAMSDEVMARLTGGNPIAAPTMRTPQIDPSLLKPGTLEKILGIGGAVGTGIGSILDRRNKATQQPVSRGY